MHGFVALTPLALSWLPASRRFHADSDEDDDDEDDFGLGNVKAGALDDEEDAQLNPLRTAYQSGWERAMEPDQKIKEEDDELMT